MNYCNNFNDSRGMFSVLTCFVLLLHSDRGVSSFNRNLFCRWSQSHHPKLSGSSSDNCHHCATRTTCPAPVANQSHYTKWDSSSPYWYYCKHRWESRMLLCLSHNSIDISMWLPWLELIRKMVNAHYWCTLDGLWFREIKTVIETILIGFNTIGLNTSDSNESGYLQLEKKCLEQVL